LRIGLLGLRLYRTRLDSAANSVVLDLHQQADGRSAKMRSRAEALAAA
jgi:hypothetical protein